MSTFVLIIAGSVAQAEKAALDRKIILHNVTSMPNGSEARVHAETTERQLLDWYCETDEKAAPFPAGTLLWYGVDRAQLNADWTWAP